jgi:hypothetical protein
MRGHLLASAPIIIEEPSKDAEGQELHAVPVVLGKTFVPDPSRPPHENKHKHTKRGPLMADAEAEHLLLAGKTLEQVRRVLKRVAPPPQVKLPKKRKPRSTEGDSSRDAGLTDLLQAAMGPNHRAEASKRRRLAQPAPRQQPTRQLSQRQQAIQQQQQQARQPVAPQWFPHASIPPLPPPPQASTSKSGLINQGAGAMSALDVLADQAASQQSGPPSVEGHPAPVTSTPNGSYSTSIFPSYNPTQFAMPHTAPNWMPAAPAHHYGQTPPSMPYFHSVPGMPSHSPTPMQLDGNAAGEESDKKARSPYLKWTVQEDEQLIRAIIQEGQRWDLVANLVPSRAYHQVRQRCAFIA